MDGMEELKIGWKLKKYCINAHKAAAAVYMFNMDFVLHSKESLEFVKSDGKICIKISIISFIVIIPLRTWIFLMSKFFVKYDLNGNPC